MPSECIIVGRGHQVQLGYLRKSFMRRLGCSRQTFLTKFWHFEAKIELPNESGGNSSGSTYGGKEMRILGIKIGMSHFGDRHRRKMASKLERITNAALLDAALRDPAVLTSVLLTIN